MHSSSQQELLQVAAAASLSAADHAVESKEQLTRRSRKLPDEAQLFADGFAVGLAFALQVWFKNNTAHTLHAHTPHVTFTMTETTYLAELMNRSQQALARSAAEALIQISLVDSMMDERTVSTSLSALSKLHDSVTQALGQQEQFRQLHWWRALNVYHAQQQQQLQGKTSAKAKAASTENSSGTWLKGFFRGGKDSNAHQQNSMNMLSEVDMGRLLLQLQHLNKMQQEAQSIQCIFEAGPVF